MKYRLSDEQTVEDEAMLLCDELAKEGVSSDEIAYGLWPVMACFAPLMTDFGLRKGMAELLEGLARDLRTRPPRETNTQLQSRRRARHDLALARLRHQAGQQSRI